MSIKLIFANSMLSLWPGVRSKAFFKEKYNVYQHTYQNRKQLLWQSIFLLQMKYDARAGFLVS